MAMSFGSFASRVVATRVVALDGTGDFTDVQTAINDLPSGGGVVYVREGTYTITTTIDINKNNVALIGAGKATKIQTSSGIHLITVSSQDGVLISEIYFYGDLTASKYGIYMTSSTNCMIRNCWIENCDYGVYSTLSNVNISGCFINDNTHYGVYLLRASEISITNNFMKDNSDGQILLDGAAGVTNNSIAIVSNVLDGGYAAIGLTRCDNIIFSSNACLNNSTEGIWVGAYAINCVVNNNTFKTCDIGIRLEGVGRTRTIVVGNMCYDCTTGISGGDATDEIAHNIVP